MQLSVGSNRPPIFIMNLLIIRECVIMVFANWTLACCSQQSKQHCSVICGNSIKMRNMHVKCKKRSSCQVSSSMDNFSQDSLRFWGMLVPLPPSQLTMQETEMHDKEAEESKESPTPLKLLMCCTLGNLQGACRTQHRIMTV